MSAQGSPSVSGLSAQEKKKDTGTDAAPAAQSPEAGGIVKESPVSRRYQRQQKKYRSQMNSVSKQSS